MTDKNSNKNPLDEFFRRKAGEYDDTSWNESDWLKLESRLNARDQLAASRRRQYMLSAAAVLIISLLGYFTWQNSLELDELSRLMTPELTETPDSGDTGMGTVPENGDTDSNDIGSGAESPLADGTDVSETDRNSDHDTPAEPVDGDIITDGSQAGIPATRSGEDSANSETTVAETADTGTPIALATGNNISRRDLADSQSTLISCQECTFNAIPWRYLSVDFEIPYSGPLASGDASLPAGTVDESMPTSSGGITRPTNSGNSGLTDTFSANRFSIGVNFSPDLSTAGGLSDYTNPGYKLGLSLEYRLNRNLSLSAGFIHSTVKYQAGLGDYNPPEGYWGNSSLPYRTLAECILIDIPLNLKLNLWQTGRSGFYTTAGLSTYIMLNEEYEFSYYSGQSGEWKNRTGTVHPFSNASFSVGYELNLQQNISVRAEPYIRVPLKEVGWGNVRLYSLGSLFSINYHFF